MSADNGIYLGEFPTHEGGVEYRVIHAQAIDNVDYGTQEEQDYTRVSYFGCVPAFSDIEAARKEAFRLEEKIMRETGVLEYGVCSSKFDRPLLKVSPEEAEVWLQKKWMGEK